MMPDLIYSINVYFLLYYISNLLIYHLIRFILPYISNYESN